MKYKEQCESLRAENNTLRRIVLEFHWMARRYCNGRMTYAPSFFNEMTRELLAFGINPKDMNDEGIWAKEYTTEEAIR